MIETNAMQDKVSSFVSEWKKANDEQKIKMFYSLSFKEEDQKLSTFALSVYQMILPDILRLLSSKQVKN